MRLIRSSSGLFVSIRLHLFRTIIASTPFILAGCDAAQPLIVRVENGEESPEFMYTYAEQIRSGAVNTSTRTGFEDERLVNRYDLSGYVYDLIERYYPASPYAALGQLRQGEAYYEEGDYLRAVEELNEFIEKHPGHPQLDYAHYLAAMCAFVQISDEGLDPGDTRLAIERFNRLLEERPDTTYREEAERRIAAAETQLAATEVRLGLSLQRQKNFEGAIARYKRVVDEFETTAFVEEALYRLVETYLSIGVRSEAELYARLLGNNYPNSEWYYQAYNLVTEQAVVEEPSLLDSLLRQ